jgi:hypothetical protein
MTHRYLTRGAEVAAALHAVADDFARMPDEDLPELAVTVNVQVCQHSGTAATRTAAVDLLSRAVLNATGENWLTGDGHTMRGTPYAARHRDGIDVDVYTAVTSKTVSPDAS